MIPKELPPILELPPLEVCNDWETGDGEDSFQMESNCRRANSCSLLGILNETNNEIVNLTLGANLNEFSGTNSTLNICEISPILRYLEFKCKNVY